MTTQTELINVYPSQKDFASYGVFTPDMLHSFTSQQASHPYLINGLVRPQSINLLVGDSGLGKTPLAIQMGLSVSAGVPFLGMTVQHGRVLYCDAENGPSDFNQMVQTIAGFLGLTTAPNDFWVWSPNWETAIDGADQLSSSLSTRLINRVEIFKPRFVVVDSLRMFWPEAEQKNDDAVKLYARLRTACKEIGTTFLLCHHRRKANQLAFPVNLEENYQAWFQEAAGAHALINQSDTRLGVVPHGGQADLVLAGFSRGTGPIHGIDIARATDGDGMPIGYRLVTGIEHLNESDRAVHAALPNTFHFKDARIAMGGTSGSNTQRFLTKCQTLGILRKTGTVYVKQEPESGVGGATGTSADGQLHVVH